MKIVYLLLTHRNERQIKRLVSRLRTGSNGFLLLHHDHSKGVSLPYQNSSDIHVIRDYVPVTWGGETIALAMLRGIRWLEEEKFDFDWVIIISGQDYPIQPLHRIESFLTNTSHDAFITYEPVYEDLTLHRRSWQTECLYRYFYRSVRLFGRELRFKRRHPYGKGVDCFIGTNWLNLSRRAVEHLWSRKEMTARLVRYLKGTFCPEETLFQTLLLNDSGLDVANDDKRFILWQEHSPHPELLCLEHLNAMVGGGAFFARKFDDAVCPEILDRLDEVTAADFASKMSS